MTDGEVLLSWRDVSGMRWRLRTRRQTDTNTHTVYLERSVGGFEWSQSLVFELPQPPSFTDHDGPGPGGGAGGVAPA